jgi:hypothetical protein
MIFYTDEHLTDASVTVSPISYVIIPKFFNIANFLSKPWLHTYYNSGIVCVNYILKTQKLIKDTPEIYLQRHQRITL